MKTLQRIRDRKLQLPLSASWYLSDIGRGQGLQELHTRQSPERLTADLVTGKLDVREAAAKLPEVSEASDRSDPSDESDLSDLSDLPDDATLEDQP